MSNYNVKLRRQVREWMEQHKDLEPHELAELAASHFGLRRYRHPKWMDDLARGVSTKSSDKIPEIKQYRRGTKLNPFEIGEKVRSKENKNQIGEIISTDTGNINGPYERPYAPILYMVRWSNGVEEMREYVS